VRARPRDLAIRRERQALVADALCGVRRAQSHITLRYTWKRLFSLGIGSEWAFAVFGAGSHSTQALSREMSRAERSDPPETPLPSCPERSVGLGLPVPINARLDLLVELAEQAGERTSRKEIVATCILAAPDGADELVRWLRIYRRSSADSTPQAVPSSRTCSSFDPSVRGGGLDAGGYQTPLT
jgi:hypothetical protein